MSVDAAVRSVDWKPQALSIRFNAKWVYEHRPVASMMLIGGMCVALFEGFNSLSRSISSRCSIPIRRTRSILCPASIGYIIGAVWGPALMHKFGERRLALYSLSCMIFGLMCFGLIDVVGDPFAAINPLRLLTVFGISLSTLVLAAGMIAVPANFGSTASGQAINTYINRNVPVENQGGVFGLNSVQNNMLNLFTIMGLGIVAAIVGPQIVFLVAPLLIGAVMIWFLRYSYLNAGEAAPTREERHAFFRIEGDETVELKDDLNDQPTMPADDETTTS